MSKEQVKPIAEPTLICPNCSSEIKLTESLAAPLIARTEEHYKKLIADQQKETGRKEQALKEREDELLRQAATLDETVQARVKASRAAVEQEARRSVEMKLRDELEARDRRAADLQEQLDQNSRKLAEARKAQEAALKTQREFEQKQAELGLEIQKQVNAQVAEVRKQAKTDVAEEFLLKLKEKEIQISQMHEKIEELKQKAEQRSQELQGEAQEQRLLEILQKHCRDDEFSDVGRGEHGADIVQNVRASGLACGAILWESKRTKTWQQGWLPKLREDQRARKADVCVIVSQQMPEGIETFGLVDDVWVVSWKVVAPFVVMLRRSLAELAQSRQAREGQQTKMSLIYEYLTGPKFKMRMQAIIEAFTVMQEDLEKERKAITRLWEKRQTQIENVMQATVGMYGDFQGIAGKSLQEIEGLNLPGLDGPGGSD